MDEFMQARYQAWWEGRLSSGPLLKVFLLSPPEAVEGVEISGYRFDPQWWYDTQAQVVEYGMSPAPGYMGIEEDHPDALKAYWLSPQRRLDLFEFVVAQTHAYADAFYHFFPDHGSAVLASYFGWEPHYGHRSMLNETHPSESLEELEDALVFRPDNPWWARTVGLAQAAFERFGDSIVVGFPNFGGALDILASLRGTQNLLMDLALNPEVVKRFEHKIADIWAQYVHAMYEVLVNAGQTGSTSWIGVWGSGKAFPIQSDVASMISPRMFAEFVAPTLKHMASALDQCIYHWDSRGQLIHLDQLLAIDEIHALQWVPGEGNPPCDDDEWIPYYRRIAEAGKGIFISQARPERVGRLLDQLPPERVAMNVLCHTEAEVHSVLDRFYRP